MSNIPTFARPVTTAIPSAPTESPALTRRFPDYPDRFTFEPSSRWVRGIVGDTAVVDSRTQLLVWEPGAKVPEYAFPSSSVRLDLLEPGSAPDQHYYRPRSEDVEWFDLVVDGRRIRSAAWKWTVPGLEDYIAVSWYPGVLDAWYEEDELVHTHPRDPANRVDVLPSSRHVVVSLHGRVLADSRDAVLLFESGLPTRFYLPPTDVRLDELVTIDVSSSCPYKGHATRYWADRSEPTREIAWAYPAPAHQVSAIHDRIAFYNERVEITVDDSPFTDALTVWTEAARRRRESADSTSDRV